MDDSQLNQNLQDLIKSLNKLVKDFDPSKRRNYSVKAGNLYDNDEDTKKRKGLLGGLSRSHNTARNAVNKTSDVFDKLSGSSNELLHAFKDIAEIFVVGKVFNQLIDGGIELSKTYSQLTNVGQQFGGSLVQMGLQAAQAGVPLETFSELIQRQSTAAAVMADNSLNGSASIGTFAKSVRDSLKPFGFYGMTINQLDDVTADYAESLRKQNLLTVQNQMSNSQSVTQFASDISQFSTVTGVARDKIAETTMNALNNTALQESNLSPQQYKNVASATAGLASLPGDTGQALSNALTQTIGLGGAMYSDLGKQLFAAGQGQIVQYLQQYADKVQAGTATRGDLATFVKELQDSNMSNSQFIIAQMRAGNQDVAQIGELLTNLNGVNANNFLKNNDQEKGITQFFSTLQNTLYLLESAFGKGFYTTIQNIQDGLKGFGDTIDTKLTPIMNSLGNVAGTFVETLFKILTDPTLDKSFTMIVNDFDSFAKTLDAWLDQYFSPTALRSYGKKLNTFFDFIEDIVSWMTKHPILTLAGGIGTATALSLIPKVVALMNVRAAVVKIAGGKGSLFGDLLGGAGKNGKVGFIKKIFGLGEDAAATGTVGSEVAAGGIASTVAAPAIVGAGLIGGAFVLQKWFKSVLKKAIPNISDSEMGSIIASAGSGEYVPDTTTSYSAIKTTHTSHLKDMQNQYKTVQQQLIDEQNIARTNTTNARAHAAALTKIAELLKEQNDLQKAIGIQTTQNQKKQTDATKQTAQGIKRLT